jgi:DNA-binding XRE family transcriptional regulator
MMFNHIGKSICAARNIVGMNQDELAILAHLSRPTIHRLENGDKGVSIKTLEKLINVFHDKGVELKFDGNKVVITYTFDEEKANDARTMGLERRPETVDNTTRRLPWLRVFASGSKNS